MLCAVVDIETTGGNLESDRIIEIGVVIIHRDQVIQEFATLVDPQRPIPDFIQQLTGISDEMVRGAPRFSAIAERIAGLLKDAVFVAHNVSFDWRFIRRELDICGFSVECPRLCTVRLARRFLPGHRSYALRDLAGELGYESWTQHRALGDARAAAYVLHKIFERCGHWDIETLLYGSGRAFKMYAGWDYSKILHIPETPGVLRVLGSRCQVLHISAAQSLRRQAARLLTDTGRKGALFAVRACIAELDYEITGSWLLARLKASAEILRARPPCNRNFRAPPDLGPPLPDLFFRDIGRVAGEYCCIIAEQGRIAGYCWVNERESLSWHELRQRRIADREMSVLTALLRSEIRRRPDAVTRKPET